MQAARGYAEHGKPEPQARANSPVCQHPQLVKEATPNDTTTRRYELGTFLSSLLGSDQRAFLHKCDLRWDRGRPSASFTDCRVCKIAGPALTASATIGTWRTADLPSGLGRAEHHAPESRNQDKPEGIARVYSSDRRNLPHRRTRGVCKVAASGSEKSSRGNIGHECTKQKTYASNKQLPAAPGKVFDERGCAARTELAVLT
ncbi:hypothetical protein WOLCODRAFT_156613 [Wolfiporia cocos MD-104 SS10]|uniref:Uncharacterized protein n=1 Tax=Wolfiporia cocos (strain MD-104) TaxID=742152 RepID=A0A2H3JE09_WOLCO|nr:hypothetical protein WOLCODRAFT_156613 [Wolfiporia cocos MD-104 SS10]